MMGVIEGQFVKQFLLLPGLLRPDLSELLVFLVTAAITQPDISAFRGDL